MENKKTRRMNRIIIEVLILLVVFGCCKRPTNENDKGVFVDNQNCYICKEKTKEVDNDTQYQKPYSYKELFEDYDWIEKKNYSDYAGTYLSIDDIIDDYNDSGRNYITLMKDGKFKRNHNFCEGYADYAGLYTIKSANDIIIITLKDLENYNPNQLGSPYIHVFEYTDDKLIFVASICAFERVSKEDDFFNDYYRSFPLVDGEGQQEYDCSQSSIFAKKKSVKK